MSILQLILDAAPAAMVVVGETGIIAFTNASARLLFFEGREATGENFLKIVASATEPLRRALASDTDQIFAFEDESGPETYHVSKRHFVLDDEPHTLITVRHITQEISRQEILVLKKTLRVIGHELANSMAPASSLLRSSRQMLARPELHASLDKALQTVEERLVHLLPAFTTKEHGSGMGLALCREIVEAHDGRLRIGRRAGRGTVVSFWLPSRTPDPSQSRARLTLSGAR